MDDDRAFGGARQFQLAAENGRLHFARGMIVVIVETDFAPGDQARVLRQPIEFLVVRFGGVPGFVRMNSGRGVNPVVRLCVGDGCSQLFDFRAVADGQQHGDSRRLRASQHGVTIRVKVGNVHVGV